MYVVGRGHKCVLEIGKRKEEVKSEIRRPSIFGHLKD